MRLLDEKGRLFGKISIIDLAVVLVVILFAAGLYVKGRLPIVSSIQAPPQKLRVTFIVEEVRRGTADAATVGGGLWELKTGPYLGKIIANDVKPAIKWVETADGRVVEATVPDKFDALITVEGDGRIDATTTMLGSTDVRVGSTVLIKGANFAAETHVVSAVEVK